MGIRWVWPGMLLLLLASACATTKTAESISEAQRWMNTAAADVQSAKQAQASIHAPRELRAAEAEARLAKDWFKAKSYKTAAKHAQTASEKAKEALRRSNEARRKR